jgi:hypothetical protein
MNRTLMFFLTLPAIPLKSCIFSNFEDKISQLSGISGTYKNLLMLKESSEQQQLF